MFLLILESIGTSELILIGIIALIFLGPRKLPDIARKMGKVMADFRNTTNEFKQTWEREVNFEVEETALRTGELPDAPVPRINPPAAIQTEGVAAPEIKEIDAGVFADKTDEATESVYSTTETDTADVDVETVNVPDTHDDLSNKRNWL